MNFQIKPQGITGDIRFDENGLRDLFYIELLELVRDNITDAVNYKKIAQYDQINGIQLLRNDSFHNVEQQTTLSMQAKEFKVILRVGMPFLRKKYYKCEFFE